MGKCIMSTINKGRFILILTNKNSFVCFFLVCQNKVVQFAQKQILVSNILLVPNKCVCPIFEFEKHLVPKTKVIFTLIYLFLRLWKPPGWSYKLNNFHLPAESCHKVQLVEQKISQLKYSTSG